MSPTRDTGLFIMSESLLKNALGSNHQDINGKRSKPPQLQQERVRESAAAYSEDSLLRRPNKSSLAKLGQLFDMRTEPILLPIHTLCQSTLCVSSPCCLLNSDCVFPSQNFKSFFSLILVTLLEISQDYLYLCTKPTTLSSI